jgi:hypothetical protein
LKVGAHAAGLIWCECGLTDQVKRASRRRRSRAEPDLPERRVRPRVRGKRLRCCAHPDQ